MSSFNKVILIGNLTKDVELKYTPKGMAVARIGLAVSEKYKDKETVCFVDCDAWDKTAELVAKYCAKGSSVLIEGRLKQDSWEDKTTKQKRYAHRITVEKVQFLSKAKITEAKPETTQGEDLSIPDENIPF